MYERPIHLVTNTMTTNNNRFPFPGVISYMSHFYKIIVLCELFEKVMCHHSASRIDTELKWTEFFINIFHKLNDKGNQFGLIETFHMRVCYLRSSSTKCFVLRNSFIQYMYVYMYIYKKKPKTQLSLSRQKINMVFSTTIRIHRYECTSPTKKYERERERERERELIHKDAPES